MKKNLDFESLWQRYGKNPYLSKFNKTKSIATSTGYKTKPHDKDPFVKIYFDINGSSVLELFFNKTQEFKVFCYVLKNLEFKTGLVEINYSHCASCMGISQKQVSRGVSFLLSNDIIAKSEESKYYYINPDLVFNGDKYGLSLYRLQQEKIEKEERAAAIRGEVANFGSFDEIRKAFNEKGYVPNELLTPKNIDK